MALTMTEVSQLYVAIFNRASEGGGNSFWQTYPDMESAATAMLDTTDAKEYFGSSLNTNRAFIEHIYENTLNKTFLTDSAGVNYWTSLLDSGMSRGDVVSSLVGTIESYGPAGSNYNPNDTATINAYNQFTNRVSVSNYMADTVEETPSNYATSTAFDKDLVVTYDMATVTAAQSTINNLANPTPPPVAPTKYPDIFNFSETEMQAASRIILEYNAEESWVRDAFYIELDANRYDDIFVTALREGYDYNIMTVSFFEPFDFFGIGDSNGIMLEMESEYLPSSFPIPDGGMYDLKMIYRFEAPYTGDYYIQGGWNPGSYYSAAGVAVYEKSPSIGLLGVEAEIQNEAVAQI